MNEEEFDSSITARLFRREDFTRAEAEAGRFTTLGLALWGSTPGHLQRQLEAPYPEIPLGCQLSDLRRLQLYLQRLSTAVRNPRNTWLGPLALSSMQILAGAQRLSGLEARSEIVRRAIEFLEKR